MIKVVVNESLRTQLHNLDSRLELCDESGQTLGYFVPAAEEMRLLYAWAKTAFTDEELERARQEPGRLTIEEVLAGVAEEN